MTWPLRWAGLAAGLGISLAALAVGFPEGYPASTALQALEAAAKDGRPVMVYFGQPGCPYCALTEQFLAVTKLKPAIARDFHLVAIDVSRPADTASRLLVKSIQVNGTPTFAFLDAAGRPVCSTTGTFGGDADLAKILATARALAKGGKATQAGGEIPLCRAKAGANAGRATKFDPTRPEGSAP